MSSSPVSSRNPSHLVAALVVGLSSLALPAVASGSRCEDRVNTQVYRFSVVLSDNNTYSVAGFMYWQGQLDGKVLQVALHGATYNHKYWDAADLNGHPYSYARYMACHGFAVLALDNLGVGASSRPDGDFVTVAVEALAVHQIIEGLGSAPVAHSFRKIVLVGHSAGALEAIFLQGAYHDADALVVTGWQNTPHSLEGVPPDAVASLLSEPYTTFPPFLRTMFFYGGAFDPAMPDYDNTTLADVMPRGAFVYGLGVQAGLAPSGSQNVTGPVLLVFGQDDVSTPQSLIAGEPSTYARASSVTTQVVPSAGHDLNLHLGNVEAWARMKAWIRESVGDSSVD